MMIPSSRYHDESIPSGAGVEEEVASLEVCVWETFSGCCWKVVCCAAAAVVEGVCALRSGETREDEDEEEEEEEGWEGDSELEALVDSART